MYLRTYHRILMAKTGILLLTVGMKAIVVVVFVHAEMRKYRELALL